MLEHWRAQRGEWSTPPKLEHLGTGGVHAPHTYVATYAAIPPGYEIPVIQPRPMYVVLDVSKPTPGGLRRAELTTQLMGHPFSHLPEALREAYYRDFDAVRDAQGWILHCTYDVPNRDIFETRDYWFEKVPAAADPAKLRASSPDHPMLRIDGARSVCPASPPPQSSSSG